MSERSPSERRRVALAEAIASSWAARSLRYAVVHGLERYPERIGRDLDVVLDRQDVRAAVEAAVACGREHGFGTPLHRWSHWGLYQLALLDPGSSTALALDLLCTSRVWRAKWVRVADGPLLDRIAAGDGQVGPFRVSTEGRFLKSCVRPLLCGDGSRLGPGREWPLPLTPPPSVERSRLEGLLGEAGIAALARASSAEELDALLPGLQRRWMRSHPLAAAASLGEAAAGRVLRRSLNPAACVFVGSPEPEVVLEAAHELADEARAMFLDVRPTAMPGSGLERLLREATSWRAPPVSEFVVTVVVGRSPPSPGPLRRLLPAAALELPGGLSREQARAALRERILDLLVESYSPRRRGLLVLVAGPDGAGKSTLARRIVEELTPETSVVRSHWRPGLLPHPRALVGGRGSSDGTRPHAREPHGPLVSLCLLGYYWLDFFLGGWLRLRGISRRGGVVVVERGWWDVAVDGRRYRLRVSPRVVRALGLLLPRPDLALVLGGPPELLARRKGELSPDEVARQSARWRTMRVGKRQVLLDAAEPEEEVLDRALLAIRGDARGQDVETRILAFDYACEPEEGSEPGAGWAWARMLALLGETWVVTRANNRAPIERVLPGIPERERLHFVYVDLPAWARFWKKGQRGIRVYYLLWQLAALRAARRLHRETGFTLAWHLTFANAWFGSLAPLVGPPFVYGPVGGGVGMPPLRLVRMLGPRAVRFELARAAARASGRYLNPLARLAWSRARLVLVQNGETRAWLPPRHRAKASVFPNPVLDTAPARERRAPDPPTALYAGRLIAWKGAALAIESIAKTPDWHLLVCGDGRDEQELRRLAGRLGLDGRVRFLGTRPRDEVLRLMSTAADVLLFPSLREDAGWVVVEALACGLPVICLDRGGPRALGGDVALTAPVGEDAGAIASSLARLLTDGALPSEAEVRERARHFSSDSTLARLRELLGGAGLAPVLADGGEPT